MRTVQTPPLAEVSKEEEPNAQADVAGKAEAITEQDTSDEEEKAVTYEVKIKRVAVRMNPCTDSEVVLVLHKGERVCGVLQEVNGLPWLRVSRKTMRAHPLSSVLEEDFAWVLLDATGTDMGLGKLLEWAPAELGWCASVREERSDVYEVVGKGGLGVTREQDPKSRRFQDLLEEGSLVKAVQTDVENGRMQYELLAGDGPREGWVSMHRMKRISHRKPPTKAELQPAKDKEEEPPVDESKVKAIVERYFQDLAIEREASEQPIFNRTAFSWRADGKPMEPRSLEDEVLKSAFARVPEVETSKEVSSKGVCHCCGLPLGSIVYLHGKPRMEVHGECKAQLMLQEMKNTENERIAKEQLKKKLRHEEYGIGWHQSKIPRNSRPLASLSQQKVRHGMVAIAIAQDENGRERLAVVPTACPGAAVHLDYLSVALKVRLEEGREPTFSLDAVDAKLKHTMQIKRFEPHWLKSTAVGDVLFESDYHLKELSLGEYSQPVVGMKSCFDHSETESFDTEWAAREWFIVRKAEVQVSQDGVLIPWCKMGVEARETVVNEKGRMEDRKVTRPEHPLVKYAEDFTKNFDLIAERKSVVFHLREFAKAAILAKYLHHSQADLEPIWLELYGEFEDDRCLLEVPQIWNERNKAKICVRDGTIVPDADDRSWAVYGGVELGLARHRLVPPTASGAIMARRGFVTAPRLGFQARRGGLIPPRGFTVPSSAVSARKGLIQPAAAISARPGFFVSPSRMPLSAAVMTPSLRGVDMSLDKFDLGDATLAAREGPAALSEELGDVATIGEAFWPHLEDSAKSALQEEEKHFMNELFHPRLCDRRLEGELFVPPDNSPAYQTALKNLLKREREVRTKRKAHFTSTTFAMASPGSLFPAAWNPNFQIARGQTPKSTPPQAELTVCDFKSKVEQVKEALRSATPVFEQGVEDGSLYRIYRLGSLEVRSIQEHNAEEEVVAVFTLQGSTTLDEELKEASKDEKVDKVLLYVEGTAQDPHYFVVMETDQGNTILTEKLKDGKSTFTLNPSALAERTSLSKVLKASSGLAELLEQEAATVHTMRLYQACRNDTEASLADRSCFAEGAFSRAAARKGIGSARLAVEPFESFAARHYPRLHQLLGLQKTSEEEEEDQSTTDEPDAEACALPDAEAEEDLIEA